MLTIEYDANRIEREWQPKMQIHVVFSCPFACASFWPDAHWMCMFFAPSCFYRPAKANGRRSSKKTKQARLIPFNETVFIVFVLSATIFRLHSRHHTANSQQPRTISLTLTHSRLFLCGAHDFRVLTTAKWGWTNNNKKTIKIFMVKLKLVGFGLVCVHSIEICLEYAWCYITDAPCRSLPQKPLNSKMNHACVYFGLISVWSIASNAYLCRLRAIVMWCRQPKNSEDVRSFHGSRHSRSSSIVCKFVCILFSIIRSPASPSLLQQSKSNKLSVQKPIRSSSEMTTLLGCPAAHPN